MRCASSRRWLLVVLASLVACRTPKPLSKLDTGPADAGAEAPSALADGPATDGSARDGLATDLLPFVDGACPAANASRSDDAGCYCDPWLPDVCPNPCFGAARPPTGCWPSFPLVCTDVRTDHESCGACGQACPTTAACVAGGCTAAAVTIAGPVASCAGYVVAAGGGSVYWTDAASGTVMRASTTGGTPVTMASGQDEPTEIGLYGRTLYWLNHAGDRALMKVAAAGGTPAVVAASPPQPDAAPNLVGIRGFTVGADGTVYYSSDATVYAVPSAGGAPTPIVEYSPGAPVGLAIEGTTLVITNDLSTYIDAATVGTGVVATCGGQNDACKIARSEELLPAPIYAQGGRAYWASLTFSMLESAPTSPLGQPPQWSTDLRVYGQLLAFAVHGGSAFFAFQEGPIVEAPLAENALGAPVALEPPDQPGLGPPGAATGVTSIAADDTNVFWATMTGNPGQATTTCAIHMVAR
jgi:hypothetical protein